MKASERFASDSNVFATYFPIEFFDCLDFERRVYARRIPDPNVNSYKTYNLIRRISDPNVGFVQDVFQTRTWNSYKTFNKIIRSDPNVEFIQDVFQTRMWNSYNTFH